MIKFIVNNYFTVHTVFIVLCYFALVLNTVNCVPIHVSYAVKLLNKLTRNKYLLDQNNIENANMKY